MAMAVARLAGLAGVRPRGDPAPVAVGFINGALTFELLRRAPLLGVGKIFAVPLGYVAMGGGKFAETLAVSDATILGIIADVMVTKRSPAPIEQVKSRIESEVIGAWARARR
jgi:hypothetical protein